MSNFYCKFIFYNANSLYWLNKKKITQYLALSMQICLYDACLRVNKCYWIFKLSWFDLRDQDYIIDALS